MKQALLATLLSASFAAWAPGEAQAGPKLARGEAERLAEPPRGRTPEPRDALIELSVLHATHGTTGRDPRIGEMPELGEKPFSRYESYELLSRSRLALSKGGKRRLTLPNGRIVETRLEDVLADASLRLVASINRPGVSDFLPLLEVKAKRGQSFIVAGQSYAHGILVLVFKIVR